MASKASSTGSQIEIEKEIKLKKGEQFLLIFLKINYLS